MSAPTMVEYAITGADGCVLGAMGPDVITVMSALREGLPRFHAVRVVLVVPFADVEDIEITDLVALDTLDNII